MSEKERAEMALRERVFNRKTAVSFVIAFFILYLLLSQVDIAQTVRIMKGTNLGLYFLAMGVFYSSLLFRGLRWKKLLENVGFNEKLKNITEIYFLSWFVNCVVPAKLGDLYRSYLLRKNYEPPISRTLGTIFLERVMDIVVLVFLLFSSGILGFGSKIPVLMLKALQAGVIIAVLLLAFLAILKYRRSLITIFLPQRIEGVFARFEEGSVRSFNRRKLPVIVVYTVIIWSIEAVRMFLVTRAIGIHVSPFIVVFIAMSASLLTAIPLTPAGLGAVELTSSGIMMLVGVGKELAVSFALLDRLIGYWSVLILGGLLYWASDKK